MKNRSILHGRVFVMISRRKRKRTSDDIDCKFDTEFKEPTVYVSVTSGSLSKQKMSSGKTSGEQPDQDNESATHDTKVDATADDRNDGFKDGTRANGLKTSPDYENVIVPPSYHDVVGAEKSAEFEQHV